jgi:hypothetical protein
VALTVFHPAETSQRTADMGPVSNIIEEPREEKKERKPHDNDTEPHGLHANWNHKKEESGYWHSRVKSGEGGHEAGNRSGGSNQGRARANHHLQDPTANAAEEVEKHEIPRSKNALEDISGEPKPHHVHSKVEDSRVEKLVGDKLPNHPLRQTGAAETKEAINHSLLPRWKDFGQDENQNIQADESLYRRE